MKFLGKLLVCLISIIIFMAFIGTCEGQNYNNSKQNEELLNYKKYFNSAAEACIENTTFYDKLDDKLKEGHSKECLVCNFIIVNNYLNNEDWDDTVGEIPDFDNIDYMIESYLEFIKGKSIKCNHGNFTSSNDVNYLPLYVATVM